MPAIHKPHLHRLIHAAILLTFLLIPVWIRLPQSPLFAPLYVTRFLIFLPMLLAISLWLMLGLPGLRDFMCSRSRVLWALALLLLALWAFASQIWAFQRAAYPEIASSSSLQLAVSVLFVLVVACVAPPPRAIVALLVCSLIINAFIVILQAYHQAWLGLIFLGEFPYTLDTPGVSILQSGSLRWVRPYGLLPHPNLAAGALLVGTLAASAWLLSPHRWQRIAGIIIVALGWWALLFAFSRAAWGGLVVGGLVLLLFLRPHLRQVSIRLSLAVAAGMALAIGLAFLVGYQPLLAARGGEGQESIELRSVSDRIVFIDFALRSFGERPILGVGIGNFPWRTSYYIAETFYDLRGDNVHFVLLAAAAELGIVGLALLLLAILSGLVAAIKRLRASAADQDRAARLALFAVFVALLAVGVLDHYPWSQIHFQVAWWGCLAAALAAPAATPRFHYNQGQVREGSRANEIQA
ncbi:MAG: O-antigen ligase family protein [Chloroflexota bacterium]